MYHLGYVCDSNVDCEDGYDEKPELCAAGACYVTSRSMLLVCFTLVQNELRLSSLNSFSPYLNFGQFFVLTS